MKSFVSLSGLLSRYACEVVAIFTPFSASGAAEAAAMVARGGC